MRKYKLQVRLISKDIFITGKFLYFVLLLNNFLQVLEQIEVIIFNVKLHVVPVVDSYATLKEGDSDHFVFCECLAYTWDWVRW